ncbi:f-box wd repeat-containing protein 5-like protein, partial [Lasius niger]
MDGIEDDAARDPQTADEDVSESDNNSECLSQRSEGDVNWYYMPDSILLSIFQYLTPKELTIAGEVCRSWHRVSRDEFLWKYLFYRTYKIDPDVGIVPETIKCHKYAIISDTLLLVSGVHFGTPHSTSGEIAVFKVAPGFDLQCRVVNKPYDIFGTWYSERYLLSGNLHWLAHLVSTSVVWLNKANQESASEHVPIMTQLFRFYNGNASSIRAIMVANCLAPAPAETTEQQSQPSSSNTKEEKGNPPSHKDLLSPSNEPSSSQQQEEPEVLHHASSRLQYSKLEGGFSNWRKLGDGFEYASPIQYNQEYRQVEMQRKAHESDSESENPLWEEESESGESSIIEECDTDELANNPEKFLIFTTGSKTYTPHKVGFKRIKLVSFPRRLDPGPSLRERIAQRERERERQNTPSVEDWLNYEAVADKFDKIDHLIDLHGHIIGMGLSPDHRYLYVNTRPWPKGYIITNPLQPPPIAQEIDIHVIDLVTLKQVGTMLRAHKAYTPNNECFFIFLDVCNEYVASGAEDKHGYLWDRHYGICLAKFPHTDVVNSVAFNPRDPEMLVTTSDDYTVKIWRSRAMVKALGLDENSYRRGME